ncbi:MAG: Rieske (2Fe-2S) protein [Cyanobacteria bacterium P01_A01_bin.83]
MKRRSFLNWAGIGLLASYFPVALAACSQTSDDNSSNQTESSDTSNAEDFVSVGTEAELQSDGYLLNEESKIIVVQDSEKQLLALNPTCTHQGCIVDWDSESNTFICPCHYAKYAPDGKVLAKPASEDLPTYEVKSENGEILVKVT